MLSTRRTLALMALAAAACFPAHAQRQAPPPPPSPQFAALQQIADALGSIRGTQREWKSINRIYFVADGSVSMPGPDGAVSDYRLTRGMAEINYAIPAIRADLQLTDRSGKAQRKIEVARQNIAWNEVTPGVGATPAQGAAARRRWMIYTTPHGAVRAAMEAALRDPTSVTIDAKSFSFASPEGPMKVALDASRRPSRIEITLAQAAGGPATVVTDMSDYRDWEKLGVFFPARIVQTINGRKLQDLKITEFRSNPYVIFPIPEGIG